MKNHYLDLPISNLKVIIASIVLIGLIYSRSQAATDPSNPLPTATPTTAPSTPYHFQSETVWAKVSVNVHDQHGRFHLECQSDSHIEGWMLASKRDNKTISSNDTNQNTSFELEVPQPFDGYQLTVFVHGDNQQIPMVLELHPSQDSLWVTPTPALYEPFQPNSNRPYNTLVKSLYEQAGQAYAQGDRTAALAFLEKVLKVDPSEPQVLALLLKIEPSAPHPTPTVDPIEDLMAQAQKAEKEKDTAGAKKYYLAALKLDPHNLSAREAIDRIRDKALERSARNLENSLEAGDIPTAKALLARIKASFPHDPRITGWESLLKSSRLNSASQKAKADAAYNMGLESYRKDDFVAAKRFWEEAIEADPQYLQARQNLERLQRDHPELK